MLYLNRYDHTKRGIDVGSSRFIIIHDSMNSSHFSLQFIFIFFHSIFSVGSFCIYAVVVAVVLGRCALIPIAKIYMNTMDALQRNVCGVAAMCNCAHPHNVRCGECMLHLAIVCGHGITQHTHTHTHNGWMAIFFPISKWTHAFAMNNDC